MVLGVAPLEVGFVLPGRLAEGGLELPALVGEELREDGLCMLETRLTAGGERGGLSGERALGGEPGMEGSPRKPPEEDPGWGSAPNLIGTCA